MTDERCMIYRENARQFPEVREATREESIRIAKHYLEQALADEGHREVYVDDALLWLGVR